MEPDRRRTERSDRDRSAIRSPTRIEFPRRSPVVVPRIDTGRTFEPGRSRGFDRTPSRDRDRERDRERILTEPSRRTPSRTDRFPTRTNRVPDVPRRATSPVTEPRTRVQPGFRTTERVAPRPRYVPAEPRSGRDGGFTRQGFYRPPARIETRHFAGPRGDLDLDRGRHDNDRYRYSHRTVIVRDHPRVVFRHHDRDWCDNFGLYLGFSWPWYYGYVGVSYHYRYGHYYWPFWYSEPVCVAYVPFGFYLDSPPLLVRQTVIVDSGAPAAEEEVPVVVRDREPAYGEDGPVIRTSEYEDGKQAAPAPGADAGAAPPEDARPDKQGETEENPPPTFDAATEKYLRDGSAAFAKADYEKASKAFRMAVVAHPDAAAPKFAFAQALVALGDYPYAARVLREAITTEPEILNAPGSIVGVYKEPEEFYRVLSELKTALLKKPGDKDLLFLVTYQTFFSGDPQAVVYGGQLAKAAPDDPMVGLFRPALAERFPGFSRFPEPKAAGSKEGK